MRDNFKFDKFVALLELRRELLHLGDEGLLKWLHHYDEQCVANNGREKTINNVFKRLYEDGETTGETTLKHLIEYSQSCQQQNESSTPNTTNMIDTSPDSTHSCKDNGNKCSDLEALGDDILREIATHLTNQELFTKYGLISYKFHQISRHPKACPHWEMPLNAIKRLNCVFSNDVDDILHDIPKFNIYPRLCKLNSVVFETKHVGTLDLLRYYGQWPKSVKIRAYLGEENDETHVEPLYFNDTPRVSLMTMLEKVETLHLFALHIDLLEKILFQGLSQINRLSEIVFEDCWILDYGSVGIEDFLPKFLDLILPGSAGTNLHEKDSSNDHTCLFEEKEAPDESNYPAKIEKLAFIDCRDTIVDFLDEDLPIINKILEQRDDTRIRSACQNLKSFQYSNCEDTESCYNMIAAKILNATANTLQSLHISDMCVESEAWKLITTRGDNIADRDAKSWFPKNLEELCISHPPNVVNKLSSSIPQMNLWHDISEWKLQKLKRLKISTNINRDNMRYITLCTSDLSELITRGLQSFSLKLATDVYKYPNADMGFNLSQLYRHFRKMFELCEPNSNTSGFVFNLHFQANIHGNEDGTARVANTIYTGPLELEIEKMLKLFGAMKLKFVNSYLGVKFEFKNSPYQDYPIYKHVKQHRIRGAVERNVIQKILNACSEKGIDCEHSLTLKNSDEICVFAILMKNKQYEASDSYLCSKFECCCPKCEDDIWLQ